MKIIILSPNANKIFTRDQLSAIRKSVKLEIINKVKSFVLVKQLSESGDKIVAIDPDFCNWKVTKQDLEFIPNLKAVCLQTASFSWIDNQYLASKKIPLMNLNRGFCANAVAEWAIMNAMMLTRQFPRIIKSGWKEDYNLFLGSELAGKTAGIIGLGKNGKAIAQKCTTLGMNVIYWSKNSRDSQYKNVSLNKIFGTADYIFPCFALNNKTTKLITDKMIRSMKKNANMVCNLTVTDKTKAPFNHQLVLNMVRRNKINGYAFEEEGGKTFNKYQGNVLATPALAWYTKEALQRNAAEWTENIIKAAKGDYQSKVN